MTWQADVAADWVLLKAVNDVVSCARVADTLLESLIDDNPVDMWVRVFHDKLHAAIADLDEVAPEGVGT